MPAAIKQHPFIPQQLRRPSLIHRMLRRMPADNAIRELRNALASTERISELRPTIIADLSSKYRVDMCNKFAKEFHKLYTEFITYCLRNNHFSQEEADDLFHLQHLLALSDRMHNQIYQDIGANVYKRRLNEVLADSRITDEEKRMLDSLRHDLELPESVANKIYSDETSRYLQNKLDAALKDKMLSPEEEKEIHILAKQLGANIERDAATSATLQRCRLMWRIVHGDPPELRVSINLQRNEVCYFTTDVKWHEMRRQRQRIQYAGPTMRLKICKGVYWRMGDLAIRPVTQDVLTLIDEGTAYVTNKRLIFTGKMKNTNIRLNKILDITPYRDGVMVEKDSGKSPFLGFTSNVDMFSACLARAIQDSV